MPIQVFDFFSGCGGTSQGFQEAGHELVFAIDADHGAAKTYRRNFPDVHFIEDRIENLTFDDLAPLVNRVREHDPILFCGCAPCQPFTKQNTVLPENDERVGLLAAFGQFIAHFMPDYIFVENVPGVQRIRNQDGPLQDFIALLGELGYHVKHQVVASQSYGVPQRRRRLVLIAALHSMIDFPLPTHGPETEQPEFSTVREWIGDYTQLPPIAAGETHPGVQGHRAANLSPLNMERITNTPPGGDRRDWPQHLHLDCHRGYSGHPDVYGRMHWGAPATGLTTRCTSLSNGRFGHPEQNRAITPREAARLQTFPMGFILEGSLVQMTKQIGNAVPVLLAQKFGENFNRHALEVN
ncbi:MAG: DNA cytosine methyltransferase [Acidobacteriota bacterium]|nr:DNA cytosine methyltransferase [Acidobacteriota bacterium]